MSFEICQDIQASNDARKLSGQQPHTQYCVFMHAETVLKPEQMYLYISTYQGSMYIVQVIIDMRIYGIMKKYEALLLGTN